MVKVRLPLFPPPGAGLNTFTMAVPGVAKRVEATLAVRLLLLTKVVGSAVPFQFTTEPLMKFDPVSVSERAAEPAKAEDGDKALRAGTGLLLVLLKSVMVILSKLMRLVPASLLRISIRTEPDKFRVKLVVASVVVVVLTVLPA